MPENGIISPLSDSNSSSPLNKQVFSIDKIVDCYRTIEYRKFFFVKRHATTLYKFAHLAFTGKHSSILSEQFNCGLTYSVGGYLKTRHTLENVEQCMLVKSLETIFG